jgi:hypothetical protein
MYKMMGASDGVDSTIRRLNQAKADFRDKRRPWEADTAWRRAARNECGQLSDALQTGGKNKEAMLRRGR